MFLCGNDCNIAHIDLSLFVPLISHLLNYVICSQSIWNYRSQKFPVKEQETTSQCSSIFENSTTKRQKLEFGYLRKVFISCILGIYHLSLQL